MLRRSTKPFAASLGDFECSPSVIHIRKGGLGEAREVLRYMHVRAFLDACACEHGSGMTSATNQDREESEAFDW